MKRFFGTLVALVVLFSAIVAVMHVVSILRLQKDVDAAYTLTPQQEYLFLGSSQVGCGIEEAPQWRNKVLWVSDTTVLHSLVRLKELERRGQLKHVRKVVIPFNFVIPQQYSERTLKWGWYQELPVAYRHFEYYPFSKIGFLAYVASNLRWPFLMAARSVYPKGRPAISQRPENWRNKFLADACRNGTRQIYGKGCCSGWESLLKVHLNQMKDICDRHGIALIAFHMPVLPEWRNSIPAELFRKETEWFSWLEQTGVSVVRFEDGAKFDASQFFDTVHLMEAGTHAFTEDVMRKLCGQDK